MSARTEELHARNTYNQDAYPADRVFLPRNFKAITPLQSRLTTIYYEARRRAAMAAMAAQQQGYQQGQATQAPQLQGQGMQPQMTPLGQTVPQVQVPSSLPGAPAQLPA